MMGPLGSQAKVRDTVSRMRSPGVHLEDTVSLQAQQQAQAFGPLQAVIGEHGVDVHLIEGADRHQEELVVGGDGLFLLPAQLIEEAPLGLGRLRASSPGPPGRGRRGGKAGQGSNPGGKKMRFTVASEMPRALAASA